MPEGPGDAAAADLFETLSAILIHVTLSEIAISPYVLPLASTEGTGTPTDARFSPPAIHPFALLELDKLVVPQKPLYLVYMHAVNLLAELDLAFLRQTPQSATAASDTGACSAASANASGSSSEDAIATAARLDRITRVVLLQNPEYVKALNVRKRLLLRTLRQEWPRIGTAGDVGQSPQVDGTDDSISCNIERPIEAELAFTALLLGINANAKMATLWHHRKWCLHLLCTLKQQQQTQKLFTPWPSCDRRARHILHFLRPIPSPGSQSQSQLRLSLSHAQVQNELSLVAQSVQRYPRNYQAWSHRTWLITSTTRPLLPADSREGAERADVLRWRSPISEELDRVRDHIRLNVTDHTAVAHTLRLLALLGESSATSPARSEEGREYACEGDDQRQEWLDLAKDLVKRYGNHETPWLLLRGVVQLHSFTVLARSGGKLGARASSVDELHAEEQKDIQRPGVVSSVRVGPLGAIELGLSASRAALTLCGQATEHAESRRNARQGWQRLQDEKTLRHAQRSHLFFGALLRGCEPGRPMESEGLTNDENTVVPHVDRGLGSTEGRALLEACRRGFVDTE